MKSLAILTIMLGILFGFSTKSQAGICPVTSNTNSDCGYIITFTSSGTVSGASTGGNPYDGSDDALIGVINNSGSAIGSITLSGSGNGGGIFAFDGDGICTYVACSYSDPTGYEGPITSFSAISSDGTTGTVNFIGGLSVGSETYFSLEGSPSSISGGLVITPTGPITPSGPTTTPTGVPEPSALVILAGALLGLATMRARSRA